MREDKISAGGINAKKSTPELRSWNFTQCADLRRAYDELAGLIFGIGFSRWHELGYSEPGYRMHSILEGDRMVANASTIIYEIRSGSESYQALQFGGVMSHPDFRGKGLTAGLMRQAIASEAANLDLFFLFAHQGVQGYYPKFGVLPCERSRFTALPPQIADATASFDPEEKIRRLDLSSQEDRDLLLKASLGWNRPGDLKVIGSSRIALWYCSGLYANDLYLLEGRGSGKAGMILVAQEEEAGSGNICLADFMALERGDESALLERALDGVRIIWPELKRIDLGFGPGLPGKWTFHEETDSPELFVFCTERGLKRGADRLFGKGRAFPALAII